MNRTRAITHPERGQTLPIFILALTVLVWFTAMAIDIGLIYEDRRHMRKPSGSLPVMRGDPRIRLGRQGYLPGDPGSVKHDQVDVALTIALLAVCVITLFLALVIAMGLGGLTKSTLP